MLGHLSTIHRYLRTSNSHIEKISDFIMEANPDIVGLLEVDTGSYRTRFVNQVELIANRINHQHHSHVKYRGRFFAHSVPILRKQANALLTKMEIPEKNFHFLPVGFKKLIIEAEIEGLRFFLVHLSLNSRARKIQLAHISELAKRYEPIIIAGDFNTFNGEKELEDFQSELRLINPNHENKPTYPSWKPKKQLDFILCSKSIKIKNFQIPSVKFSDHLPLILDIAKPRNKKI